MISITHYYCFDIVFSFFFYCKKLFMFWLTTNSNESNTTLEIYCQFKIKVISENAILILKVK